MRANLASISNGEQEKYHYRKKLERVLSLEHRTSTRRRMTAIFLASACSLIEFVTALLTFIYLAHVLFVRDLALAKGRIEMKGTSVLELSLRKRSLLNQRISPRLWT